MYISLSLRGCKLTGSHEDHLRIKSFEIYPDVNNENTDHVKIVSLSELTQCSLR